MAPPDGARTNRIPALSWDSVVESAPAVEPAVADAHDAVADAVADSVTLAPLTLDVAEPAGRNVPIDGVRFAPRPLGTRTAPPSVNPGPVPAPPSRPEATPAVPDEPVVIRTAPPAVIIPAIGDVTSGPDVIVAPAPAPAPAPEPAPAPAPAPAAAPEPELEPALEPALAAAPASVAEPEPALPPTADDPSTTVLPTIREATPVEVVAPLLPSVPAPALRPTAATSFEFDPAAVAPANVAHAVAAQQRPRKKRGGLKLVAGLVVLGGLVAAGVVFGQPYLFPGEWDDASAPYAEAVEAATGVEFLESLSIVSEPTAEFGSRLQTEFASVSPEELAQWRALGLASGAVDDATLAKQVTGWRDAVYSTLDGQVYHDQGAAGPELDAQLVQEMAAASLDQQFGWSGEQPERTLDAAAATYAEVLRQARAVQQDSDFAEPVPPVPTEVTDALPPVIGYRMLAPHVYAEYDAALEVSEGINPLADLGAGGPGMLGNDSRTLAPGPTLGAGDAVVGSPAAMDRSFWFLVFAGYLDARTAYDASEAVVESALTATSRGAMQCVAATFAGGGIEQTDVLRSALTAWSAAAPPAFGSSFEVLADGTLQLVSCDPGTGFDAATRPGVARELIAWRTAELATMEAVSFAGGGEANFLEAWPFAAASPTALDVAALPVTATPSEMAAATRAAISALFTPAG